MNVVYKCKTGFPPSIISFGESSVKVPRSLISDMMLKFRSVSTVNGRQHIVLFIGIKKDFLKEVSSNFFFPFLSFSIHLTTLTYMYHFSLFVLEDDALRSRSYILERVHVGQFGDPASAAYRPHLSPKGLNNDRPFLSLPLSISRAELKQSLLTIRQSK